MENCLFVCGSPQYMDNAIKSVLYYKLMTSTAALQLCVSSFSFFANSFVMEMKLELNLCSQGENKAPQVETVSWASSEVSKQRWFKKIFLKVESIGKNGLWFNFSMKISRRRATAHFDKWRLFQQRGFMSLYCFTSEVTGWRAVHIPKPFNCFESGMWVQSYCWFLLPEGNNMIWRQSNWAFPHQTPFGQLSPFTFLAQILHQPFPWCRSRCQTLK